MKRSLGLFLLLTIVRIAAAQTATNTCGFTAGAQYTVNSSCTLQTFDKPGAFTATINPGSCGAGAFDDAWGWFQATATTTAITYDPAGTENAILHVLSGACGSLALAGCANNGGNGVNETVTIATSIGTNYVIRVQRSGTNNAMSGSLCIWNPPLNDIPCTATTLTVNSSCTNTAGTNVNSSASAGIGNPSCGNYTGTDVWYSFVAPASGIANIETSGGTINDSGIALYSATACAGTFTQIACNDDNGVNLMSTINQTGLTPGTTYYIRVWGYGGATGTFNICVWTPPPPPNDNPCAATPISVNASCFTTSATNVLATATAGIPAPGCAAYSGGDVWFTFVAPASGSVTIQTTAGSLTNSGMALYSATACAGTYTLIECDDDDGAGSMSDIIRGGLTPGTTYYLRVWGNGGATGTFGICVWGVIPVPANDNPCGAVALTVNTSCTATSATNSGSTLTAGIPDPGCGGTIAGDVWFAIVAPTNEFLTLRITPGTMSDPAMALYSAPACGGAMTLMQCDDNLGSGNEPFLTFTPGNLVAGQTYYLRVWNASGPQGTFNICAFTTGASCFMALRLFDEGNNGWGGSRVTVQVGAGAPVNYTLTTEGANIFYIPFTAGQLVQVSYATMGAGSQGEVYYFIQIGAGILYSGGPTPATGLVYAALPSCGSIPPPSSDCSGGERLCSGTAFSGSPSNTGTIADLNFQTRGCLSTDERQGNWYHFIPSASGTIGMTISPTNPANDYDFAIWGPAVSRTCPPINTPYRCSYSGLGGNTGLGNGAVDLTEGSGGNKWVAPMNVLVGEHYTLYISNFSRSGLAFNLSWQFTNGADISCIVLPVELLSFDGRAEGDAVQLEWITATESGSSHYDVERSFDGYTFTTIGQVEAAGTSYSTIDYAFVDPQPMRGVNYYRLKQVDLDGTTDISDIVAVTFARGVTAGKPYPNPTATRINIDLTLTADTELTVQLLDATGRLVRSYQQGFSVGTQLFSAPVDGLETGAYSLLITDASGEHMQAGRFIVE